VAALWQEGIDVWTAQQRVTCRRRHAAMTSVDGAVMGGRSGSHAEMGRGAAEAGRRGEKQPAKLFLFGIPFPFKFSSGVKIY
jgi:hypothetical protein